MLEFGTEFLLLLLKARFKGGKSLSQCSHDGFGGFVQDLICLIGFECLNKSEPSSCMVWESIG